MSVAHWELELHGHTLPSCASWTWIPLDVCVSSSRWLRQARGARRKSPPRSQTWQEIKYGGRYKDNTTTRMNGVVLLWTEGTIVDPFPGSLTPSGV